MNVGAGPRTDTGADGAFSTRITVNQQLSPDLAQQQINPVTLPGFDLPTGQNGLFRLNEGTGTPTQGSGLTQVRGLPDRSFQANPQKYLIETNPALTDKGMGTGHDVTHINSTVDTGLLVLKSGQDTTLAGAQVRADAIKADIGGNLNIASRQDEASRKNKQTSGGIGVSICVPPFCLGSMVSGSAEFVGSKMNSDYRAVTDQTGLFAGGGYDIYVGKNTTLQGAVIASEASVDKNHLSTGRLLVSDIKNKSDIKSQPAGLSYSGATAGFSDARSGGGGAIPLMLKDSDSSKTRSAVSPGIITVRDAAGANDLVGLNRDTANANKQLDRPDEKAMQERIDLIQSSAQLSGSVINMVAEAKMNEANKLRKQADAQSDAGSPGAAETARAADAAFAEAQRWQVGGDKKMMADIASGLFAAGLGGATGGTAVGIVANTTSSDIFSKIGDYAQARSVDPKSDAATRAAWAEGGAARVMLHALAGAAIGLSSGSAQSGALGAGASAALMPAIADALEKNGIKGADQDALAALIATGVGGIAGSGSGTTGVVVAGGNAMSVDVYNRAAHEAEKAAIKAEAEKGDFTEENLEKALCYSIKCWAQLDRGSKEYHDAYLTEADMVGLSNELEWIDAQRDNGLFQYSRWTDAPLDFATRDLIPLGGSAVSIVGGGVGVYSGGVLCASGGGCIIGGPMAAFGASTAIEGGSGFYNHFVNGNNNSYNPLKVGFSQLPGGYGPLIYSGTDLILSIGAGFVKVPLKMGLADGLNRPKTMFNVTVRNADNNYFVPMTGIPTPYGTAMMMYFRSVGDKAFTVYEEASSERK